MKRPRQSAARQNAGPLALFGFVVNVTASFFRQFSRHISTWEKELNRRRQTLKPLENQGFFRLSLLYRNGNTMVVNVNTRRYELAVLESIGMTKRQIKRMLFMEGFYYWGVSLSLAVTIGTAIFILLYMVFSKVAYYAVFSYPFIPLVLVSGLVLLICLIVPIWVYKTDVNLPVVERLRLTE